MKFIISESSRNLIHSRLSAVLPFDSHAGPDGSYHIKSLYFDDRLYHAWTDKEAGVIDRSKYRIRYYNDDPSFIRLEEKRRIAHQSEKTGVVISRSTADDLITRNASPDLSQNDFLYDFARKVRTGALFPVLFTDYIRSSFCHPVGELRITLDQNIAASRFSQDLFRSSPAVPVLQAGESVLEVKYSGVYPPFITDLIKDVPRVKCGVSKYCMCCEALF